MAGTLVCNVTRYMDAIRRDLPRNIPNPEQRYCFMPCTLRISFRDPRVGALIYITDMKIISVTEYRPNLGKEIFHFGMHRKYRLVSCFDGREMSLPLGYCGHRNCNSTAKLNSPISLT